jgi:hypothetical protein
MADPIAPQNPSTQPPAGETPPATPAPQTPASGGETPPANEADKTVPYARFSEVNERAKTFEAELAAIKKQQNDAENKRLAEEGKHKELADKEKARADSLEAQVRESKIENRVTIEAAKLNILDVEAALKLIDRSAVKIDKDGNVSGIEDALKALVEAKPYLINSKQQAPIGSPTNPGAPGNEGVKKFKLSQIQDRSFYKANEKDIDKALKLGLVEDDTK